MPVALSLCHFFSKGNIGWYTPCLKSPSETLELTRYLQTKHLPFVERIEAFLGEHLSCTVGGTGVCPRFGVHVASLHHINR
jgi:hypothetical protein